ncbi:hypothetical protein GCM10028791_15020 [Echinicola sediminis]
MKNSHLAVPILLLALIWQGCREIYDPEINQEDLEVLVVEGNVEVEGGVSEISLSYTSPIGSGENSFRNVPDADIVIAYRTQGGEEIQHSMQRTLSGTYTLDHHFNSENQHRLIINIPGKGKYQSDWIMPTLTPTIDEIGFIQNENREVEIYVNTIGNEDAQYFVWDFEETWMFSTPLISFLKYVRLSETKDTVVYRNSNEMTHECFLSETSSKVVIGSSGQYQDHLIHQKKIQQIPYGSEKLGRRYSIRVRQRAVSKEAYDFYEILRKNSDDIGGIFSPLPSVLGTNIHHESNSAAKAIGYVTVGTTSDKRIYIGRHEIDDWRVNNPYYAGCEFSTDTVPVSDISIVFNNNFRVPVSPISSANDPTRITAYVGASTKCTDCTLRGTKEKPDFWEY